MYKHETPITSFPLYLFTHQLISKTIKGCAQCTKLALLQILGEVIDRQTYPELPFLDMVIPRSQKKEKKKNAISFFTFISYTLGGSCTHNLTVYLALTRGGDAI